MNEVFEKIKKKTQKVRYKIAWLVAADLIDDLEYRLGSFLCNQTGGLLSKAYYPLEYMKGAAAEHFDKLIDDSVRDFAELLKESANEEAIIVIDGKWAISQSLVDNLLIEWGVGVENV